MGPEAKLEKQVTKYAKEKGCLCFKFSSPSNRGVPDRIIIAPGGRVLFLELKAPGKRPTKLQEKYIDDIWEKGCLATWADNFEDAQTEIDNILNPVIE